MRLIVLLAVLAATAMTEPGSSVPEPTGQEAPAAEEDWDEASEAVPSEHVLDADEGPAPSEPMPEDDREPWSDTPGTPPG